MLKYILYIHTESNVNVASHFVEVTKQQLSHIHLHTSHERYYFGFSNARRHSVLMSRQFSGGRISVFLYPASCYVIACVNVIEAAKTEQTNGIGHVLAQIKEDSRH